LFPCPDRIGDLSFVSLSNRRFSPFKIVRALMIFGAELVRAIHD
jgi:hypothetical protein